MKNERGITLIALVITIIVLLILAGVAIGIALNGGDIFGKASQARSEWNLSVETENITLQDAMKYLNIAYNGTTQTADDGPWVDTYGGLATEQEETRARDLFIYEITSEQNKEAKVVDIDWTYVDDNTSTNAEKTALLKKVVIPHEVKLDSEGYYDPVNGSKYTITSFCTLTSDETWVDYETIPDPNQPKYASGSSFRNSRILEDETSLIIPSTIKIVEYKSNSNSYTLPRNKIIFAPNSQLEMLDEGALMQTRHLETLVLPEGLTTIKDESLSYCYSLRQIYIPSSVTTIENYAMFYGVSYRYYDAQKNTMPSEEINEANMNEYHVTFYYEGTQEQWQNISPEKWEYGYNLEGIVDIAGLDASTLTTVKFNQTPTTMASDTDYVHLWKD